ncbi:MAG: ABC transporter ATP-binding protein [Chloroflexota bacterium]
MPAVTIDHVSLRFGSLLALNDVSFTVRDGEFVSLLGPSGCGKTTLLNAIGDLIQPSEGAVTIDGLSPATVRLHRQLGFVFQRDTLLKNLSAVDNVRLPMDIAGLPRAEADARARAALQLVGLAGREQALPHHLSGGMRQRVAIARVFASDYRLLLMDEPFAALDAFNKLLMADELLRIWQEAGKQTTVIFVTHDWVEAAFLSDRVLFMSGSPGRVKAEITVPFARPRAPELRLSPEFVALSNRLYNLYLNSEEADSGSTPALRGSADSVRSTVAGA